MKTIVIGVDGSERTQLVLDAGRAMAERLNASVVLVSAIEGIEWQAAVPPELASLETPAIWAQIEKEARDRLSAAAARFPEKTVIEKRVERAPAWYAICDAAKKHSAALVVVGAHSYRGWERLLGTTASKVANRADTSVLVVRRPESGQAAFGFERLLVAHDGSERAAHVLASAQVLAAPSSGRIVLVRAIDPAHSMSAELWGKRPEEIEQLLVGNARAALNRLRAGLPDNVPSEVEARVGAAWEVVTDAAKAKNVSLIIIGSHGFDAIDRVLGTVAGRIVNQADRSVLIARGHGVA